MKKHVITGSLLALILLQVVHQPMKKKRRNPFHHP